jgi:DNA modification methylase
MYSSNAGDLVFDPFLGSGTVAIVSQREGRHFLGFEIVPEYFAFANETLCSPSKKA